MTMSAHSDVRIFYMMRHIFRFHRRIYRRFHRFFVCVRSNNVDVGRLLGAGGTQVGGGAGGNYLGSYPASSGGLYQGGAPNPSYGGG
jgi:hypothetical protein